jgi:hypothetical protein
LCEFALALDQIDVRPDRTASKRQNILCDRERYWILINGHNGMPRATQSSRLQTKTSACIYDPLGSWGESLQDRSRDQFQANSSANALSVPPVCLG